MSYRSSLCYLTLAALIVAGCSGSGPAPMQREKTYKVTGKLLIDGKAEPQVKINMVRVGQADPGASTSKGLTPDAMTDSQGNFSIGTYDAGAAGDGATNGDYVLTFQWGMINLIGGNYSGDKFNGKYADPKASEFKVKVDGKPVDLGTITLDAPKDAPATTGIQKGRGFGAGAEDQQQERNRRAKTGN